MLPAQNDLPRANLPARWLRIPAPILRQHARLSIGVGGLVGGSVLLATNVMSVVIAGASFSPIPFLANAALIFGGIMFLRERRSAARSDSQPPTRSLTSS